MFVLGSASNPNCSAMVVSDPVKPRAKRASSHFHSFSEPGISLRIGRFPGSLIHSTSEVINPFKLPFPSPTNRSVEILKKRSAPSLWEELVLNLIGQNGHGWSLGRSRLGFPKISKLETDLAPCLKEVPIQSDPVSPPPMTTTFLSVAFISSPSNFNPPTRRL